MKRLFLISLCLISGGLSACGDDKPKVEIVTQEVPVYEPSKECLGHEMLCDGACTDIWSSASNCGTCKHRCDANEVCLAGACTGCTGRKCGDECVDISSSVNHCGVCGNGCASNMICSSGVCKCDKGWVDCDGESTNGCETRLMCACIPGEIVSFYDGEDETLNVGECKAGNYICRRTNDGSTILEVENQAILPTYTGECTLIDYNCNGIPDGYEDLDGDGFTPCDGDCCDSPTSCRSTNPELINPGMIDVVGNGHDDNCNDLVDEDVSSLENAVVIPFDYNASMSMSDTAKALAYAMGIRWVCAKNASCGFGLIDAKLTRSGSSVPPYARQVNVVSAFRDADNVARVLPKEGATFAVLSTGYAMDVKTNLTRGLNELDQDDSNEAYTEETVSGMTVRHAAYSKVPEVYLSQHEGQLATHSACLAPEGWTPSILDSVQLHLELKVPVNAKGIAFDFRFFSREYPEYLCSQFNDFFLALLDSKHPDLANYPDHNIAFDEMGNPVSINNGFFTTCAPVSCTKDADCPKFMGCSKDKGACANKICHNDENGKEVCELSEEICKNGATAIDAYYPRPYGKYADGRGGGTAWLSTTAPVVGGETIKLDFHIWDTQDGKFDSTVMIDNFRWLLDETKVNTGFAEDMVVN